MQIFQIILTQIMGRNIFIKIESLKVKSKRKHLNWHIIRIHNIIEIKLQIQYQIKLKPKGAKVVLHIKTKER